MKLSAMVAALVVLCLASAAPVMAGTLYTNGPVNGNTYAWTIIDTGVPNCCSIADSFTVTNSTVTGATFYTWTFAGDVPATVNWAITTAPFGGTTLGSGTANLTDTFLFANGGYNVNSDSFSIPALTLAAGTYWLQLGSATDTAANGDFIYWDENDGPSQAWDSFFGPGPITPANSSGFCSSGNASGECSQSFYITGTTSTTPEPSSLLLMGSGLIGVAGTIRRKFLG